LVLTALIAGSGNLINDYFDAEIDRVNKPRRPIPSGRLSKSSVLALYSILTPPLTLCLWLLLPLELALLMTAWETMIFLYAQHGKRLPLLGNITVALVASSSFLAGALAAGRPGASLFPFLFAFVFVMARELIKGAEDREGDLRFGASTVATLLGAEAAARWATVPMFLCVLMAPLPALTGSYGLAYFVVMEGALVPGLLYCALLVTNEPERRAFSKASWLMKGLMVVGVVALALARL